MKYLLAAGAAFALFAVCGLLRRFFVARAERQKQQEEERAELNRLALIRLQESGEQLKKAARRPLDASIDPGENS